MTRELKDMTEQSYSQLALKTGFKPSNISRMLSGRHSPKLENFITLCDASNVEIILKKK